MEETESVLQTINLIDVVFNPVFIVFREKELSWITLIPYQDCERNSFQLYLGRIIKYTAMYSGYSDLNEDFVTLI